MDKNMMMQGRPRIAIVDSNTLAVLGLKQLLQTAVPVMQIDTFGSIEELESENPESFFHYFVSMSIVLENRAFFLERRVKTIVLTTSSDPNAQLSGFHCLCINVPEEELVKSILRMQQHAHPHGKNMPPEPRSLQKILSDREIEVLSLIVQGYINKEIADQLNIGMTTVITHRKNIMEKLGLRSVSALTLYAVMHGYVDINKI